MADRYAPFESMLAAIGQDNRLRRLTLATGHDFSSNDYLGLASSARLTRAAHAALERGVPVGAGGSRLLRGHHAEHEALEAEAAAFFQAPACLSFGSGYAANMALLSTLPQRGDLIVHDALVHASAHEGMRRSRAPYQAFAHNDPDACAQAIAAWRAAGGTGTIWIVVESLYSMDGDRAPLADLFAIAERHEAFVIVDEAHATGVFGARGAGLAEAFEGHPALIGLHTCGKALGVSGALVTADARLIAFLVNRARPFIYATAPSPLNAALVRESLRILTDETERRALLAAHVTHAHACMAAFSGLLRDPRGGTGTQIMPLVIGDNGAAVRIAARVQAAGFDVRAVRPPTVPEGSARLRISITLNVSRETIAALAACLADVLAAEVV